MNSNSNSTHILSLIRRCIVLGYKSLSILSPLVAPVPPSLPSSNIIPITDWQTKILIAMLILHLSLVFQILHYLMFDVSAHPISLSKNLLKRDVLEVGVAQSHSLKKRALKQLENFTEKSRSESSRGASNSIKLQASFGKENKMVENSVPSEELTDLHEFTNFSKTSKKEGRAKGSKILSVVDNMGENKLTKDSRNNSGKKRITEEETSSSEKINLEVGRFEGQEHKTTKDVDPLKGISVQPENHAVEDFLRRIETNNHQQEFTGGYAAALRYIYRI